MNTISGWGVCSSRRVGGCCVFGNGCEGIADRRIVGSREDISSSGANPNRASSFSLRRVSRAIVFIASLSRLFRTPMSSSSSDEGTLSSGLSMWLWVREILDVSNSVSLLFTPSEWNQED